MVKRIQEIKMYKEDEEALGEYGGGEEATRPNFSSEYSAEKDKEAAAIR